MITKRNNKNDYIKWLLGFSILLNIILWSLYYSGPITIKDNQIAPLNEYSKDITDENINNYKTLKNINLKLDDTNQYLDDIDAKILQLNKKLLNY